MSVHSFLLCLSVRRVAPLPSGWACLNCVVSPHWTASTHHLVAGVLLAVVLVLLLRRWTPVWLAFVCGVVLTLAAELLIELAEYVVLYRNVRTVSAYFDTIADMGMTAAGAVLGGLVAVAVLFARGRRQRG